MIMSSRGKRLWIVDETGQVQPVASYADITGKARGGNLPDWWVEEKDPDWTPEPGRTRPMSLLRLGMTQNDEMAHKTSPRMPKDGLESGEPGESTGAGGGVDVMSLGHGAGMKIGAGHKPQPYDEHGRYTGPTGASISMDGSTIHTFSADSEGSNVWRMNGQEDGGQEDGHEDASAQDAEQRVEEMAREMQRAAEELEAARQQAQDGYKELDGVLIADSGQIRSDAGGLSGGTEVRGPVTGPEKSPSLPLPPTPKEPHLTYSQESGELRGPDGKLLTVGHAGRGGGLNNPDAEGIKGVGPLPQGNWRMEEVKTSKWPDPSYKLTPDPETRDRVVALGRDPDSFYVHAQARDPKDLARDSSGCIALDKTSREALSAFNRRWIRVEK